MDVSAYLRVSPMECRDITVQLPVAELSVVTWHLNHSPLFHAVCETKWDYLGYFPVLIPQGLVTFGNIEVFPATGTVPGGGGGGYGT